MEEKTPEKSLESGCIAEEGKVETNCQSPSAAPSSMASSSKVKTVNDSFQHQIEDLGPTCGQCKYPIKLFGHFGLCKLGKFRGKGVLGTLRALDHGDQGQADLNREISNGDDQKTVPNQSPGGNKELKQTPSNKPQLALIVDSGEGKSERKTVLATEDKPGQGKSVRKTVRVSIWIRLLTCTSFDS